MKFQYSGEEGGAEDRKIKHSGGRITSRSMDA